MARSGSKQTHKRNKPVIALGIILVILGAWLVFSSGADFSNLPLLDLSVKIGSAEVTATDISPEAQTKIVSGFILLIVGFLLIKTGIK